MQVFSISSPRPKASSNEAGTESYEDPVIIARGAAGAYDSSAASNAARTSSGKMASRRGSLPIRPDRRPTAIAQHLKRRYRPYRRVDVGQEGQLRSR